jgi:pSer/pThr/pTyr-binding forkhead associated (FHA) protein
MSKLIITYPEKTPAHVHIGEHRMLIGRGTHCQVQLEGAAISKEHAAILSMGNDDIIEDLGSTNGTLVNGEVLKARYVLNNRDLIGIGDYQLQYVNQRAQKNMDFDKTMLFDGAPADVLAQLGSSTPARPNLARYARVERPRARLRWLKGKLSGQTIELDQVLRRIGSAGTQSALILRRPLGYQLIGDEGDTEVMLNGSPIGKEWRMLANNDVIEVGADRFAFSIEG